MRDATKTTKMSIWSIVAYVFLSLIIFLVTFSWFLPIGVNVDAVYQTCKGIADEIVMQQSFDISRLNDIPAGYDVQIESKEINHATRIAITTGKVVRGTKITYQITLNPNMSVYTQDTNHLTSLYWFGAFVGALFVSLFFAIGIPFIFIFATAVIIACKE